MIIRSLVSLVVLAVYLIAFEYQYMWYPNERETALLRAVEVISVLVASFLFYRGKYFAAYAAMLTGFCVPIFFVDTAFSWELLALVIAGLAAHGGAIRVMKHLKAQ